MLKSTPLSDAIELLNEHLGFACEKDQTQFLETVLSVIGYTDFETFIQDNPGVQVAIRNHLDSEIEFLVKGYGVLMRYQKHWPQVLKDHSGTTYDTLKAIIKAFGYETLKDFIEDNGGVQSTIHDWIAYQGKEEWEPKITLELSNSC